MMMGSWGEIRRINDAEARVSKFIFTNETAVAEAVLYRYPDFETRTVICCSTQSGCPIGCRFCGAGDHFVRNLTADEIIQQIGHLLAETRVCPCDIGKLQVMFMSMGEPLLNMRELSLAIRVLSETWPNAALLISTSAPCVDMDELFRISRLVPAVGLQFSIHESTDTARDQLIPFKAKMTLREIAETGERWMDATGRKPFLNYCAHAKNSSDADADRLLAIFDPSIFEATVSVVCERNDGLPASNEYQRLLARDFAHRLVERGFNVRVFDPAGQDTIGGGCGQLWFVQDWMKRNPKLVRKSVGATIAPVHAPNKGAAQ